MTLKGRGIKYIYFEIHVIDHVVNKEYISYKKYLVIFLSK